MGYKTLNSIFQNNFIEYQKIIHIQIIKYYLHDPDLSKYTYVLSIKYYLHDLNQGFLSGILKIKTRISNMNL